MSAVKIRPIKAGDNIAIAEVIRRVLIEMGVPKIGTAYEDASLDTMYESYNKPRTQYYVVEKDTKIFGGAGIALLEGQNSSDICELQKMYFLSEIRGLGIGYKMINKCLDYAKEQNYKQCYLETMPYMQDARKLYNKVGFTSLETSMGNTGHYSCQAWMIKTL
ncbi:GNAT family N-acetyltransferase [Aquimarina pacifica]|uniref:GNAT family N-acetyltransferase n=1 Tax=Aquimarina pacifica TaxID=1296415 RepID=UPI00046F559C|nr:GNAT family N-acetyltransferase [Aquimarina pacifica]